MAFLLRGTSNNRIEDRLEQLTGARASGAAKDNLLKDSGVLTQPLDATCKGMLEEFLAKFMGLTLWFQQADTTIAPGRFFAICGVLAGVGVVIPIVLGWHLAVVPLMGLFTGSLPIFWLMMRRQTADFKEIRQAIARRGWEFRSRGPCGPGTVSARASTSLPMR